MRSRVKPVSSKGAGAISRLFSREKSGKRCEKMREKAEKMRKKAEKMRPNRAFSRLYAKFGKN